MRYLLFFFSFIFYFYIPFSQASDPTCSTKGVEQIEYTFNIGNSQNSCINRNTESNKRFFVNLGSGAPVAGQPSTKFRCDSQCTCPPPAVYNITITNGVSASSCIVPGDETPPDDLCPSGYPKVNGQCPVCVGGQNPDGTCVDDSGGASSGANSSSPTSSPDSGSSGSAASAGGGGGDDGGNNNGGGGGGGNNGGGNNNGGGSASSASSETRVPHSGYGNWIPVDENSNCPNKYKDQQGQWWCAGSGSPNPSSSPAMAVEGSCDYTSKDYFYCITSGNGSGGTTGSAGSNSSWTPISGYGNWIPVGEDSPCPNKFKDASGKWWCAGGSTGGGSGGGGTGTASSGGAAGSAPAGECDQTASNYLDCISQGKTSSRSSGSASSVSSSAASNSSKSSSGAYSSLGEKGEFDGEASEKSLEDIKEELDKKIADIKADIQGEFGGSVSGSGNIQDFCNNIRGTQVCFGMKKFEQYLDPISQAIFLVACFLSFAIVLRK